MIIYIIKYVLDEHFARIKNNMPVCPTTYNFHYVYFISHIIIIIIIIIIFILLSMNTTHASYPKWGTCISRISNYT